MKHINIIIPLLLLLIFVASCTDYTEGLNDNPNALTDASSAALLTQAQIGNMGMHECDAARIAASWSGYIRGINRQPLGVWQYQVTSGDFNFVWNTLYYSGGSQAKLVIEKSEAEGNQIQSGIAKVIKANLLGTGTQLFGDIPFSEALDIDNYPAPGYDPQGMVYTSLQDLLDESIVNLQSGEGMVANADIHFNGDAEKWIKVANTLKARYYLDMKEYSNAYQSALLGISSTDGSLMGPHSDVNGTNLSIWTSITNGDYDAIDAYLVSILDEESTNYRGNAKTNEEARFKFYYVDGYIGSTIEPNIMSMGDGDSINGFLAKDADFPLVTYEETLLTLSEAAIRSEDFSSALGHLNEYRMFLNSGDAFHSSILSYFSFQYDAYTDADFEPGGMENQDNISKNDALLREILEERYVTFYAQFMGWTDERRNRNESVGIKLTPNTGDKLPERFLYPEESNPNRPDPLPDLFDPLTAFE